MKNSVVYILVDKELKLERIGFIYLNLNEIFMSCFVIHSFKYNKNSFENYTFSLQDSVIKIVYTKRYR